MVESSSSLLSWLLATRPKTLTAAVAPTLVGISLASCSINEHCDDNVSGIEVRVLQLGYIALCFPAAILIQIGTNLINDAEDFRRGADTEKRVGPTRVTQAGLLTMAQVHGAGVLCFLVGCLLCVPAFVARGWQLVLLVASSCCAGYAYTGGPYPLAYHGFGDITVVIFFGAVATAGLKVVVGGGKQSSLPLLNLSMDSTPMYYDSDTIVAGTQIGLLCCVLLAINNIRDYYSDKMHNKNTLIVQFGLMFGKLEVLALIFGSFGLGWWYWYIQCNKLLPALMPMAISSYIAFHVIQDIFLLIENDTNEMKEKWETEDDSAKIELKKKVMYGKTLAKSALLHLIFSAALAIALSISCNSSSNATS